MGVECRRTATATDLYDSFWHIFFFLHSFSLHLFVSQKSLNDEERGGNCLLVPERSYGPEFTTDDEHIIKWMWVKKLRIKRLLKMFLTEDEVLIR